MKSILSALAVVAALAATAAPAVADPRFTLLASDGTGYAVAASKQPGEPVTFALSDDSGSAVVESRLPADSEGRTLRVAALSRCMPGGTRLVRIYGTADAAVRRVLASIEDGARFRLRVAAAPAGWDTDEPVIGRLFEIRADRLRLTATGRGGRRLSTLTVSFSQPCATAGEPALGATLTPTATTLDTDSMTARLSLPARAEAASYAVNLVQPGWAAGASAFSGAPWGSPLGAGGDVRLDGPGTLEGATPALARVGDVCLRGAPRVVNTVIVRAPAGAATTLVWPLSVAPEPQWDTTRLQAAFRVRRGDYGATTNSNVADYTGPLGVRFALAARRRGGRVTVRGTTRPVLAGRRMTVYVLQARDRGAGARLFANDFRPFRTLRTRTDAQGRFSARFSADDRAYRMVAEATDTPGDRIDDRSCPLERDYRR